MSHAIAPATPPSYTLLGRSGLRVSRLALGTMTFGTVQGWGCERDVARAMFDRYVERGGNFIDTADIYTQGTAEKWVGEFIAESGLRDRMVVATKYTHNHQNADANPNAAGNGRKNLHRALHGSLQRLGTDCIDLYYLHTWDGVTPVEEVVRSMDDLVRAGKIRHWALSDMPAWYAARAYTLTECHGLERPCAMQLEYSLVSRGIEYEFTSLAQSLGMGIAAWSPLGGGLLSGKYRPNATAAEQNDGRIKTTAKMATPALSKLNDANWAIVAELEAVAQAMGLPMAQVAIQWAANRPGVSSVILGATRLAQLEQTLGALDVALPAELEKRLDAVGGLPSMFPYNFLGAMLPRMHGGANVISQPGRFHEALSSRGGRA